MPEWPRRINHEMRQHLDDEYEALRAGGASHAEAMRELAGDVEAIAPPPVRRFADAAADLRHALRSLRKHPAFTVVVLATLALGIGANAAIFTVVDAVLLRPLPYPDAGRLMIVLGDLHRPGVNEIPTSAGEFVDYRDRSHAFEQIAAYDTIDVNLTGGGDPELLQGAVTTASLFPALGAAAEIGRALLPADERPGEDRVVVIGHGLWTRRFNADPQIAGRRVLIDGRPARIVGVMPAAFQFPDATTEIWKPIVFDAEALSDNNRGSHGYTTIARLKPGVTPAQARADLAAVTATFKAEHPNNYRTGFSTSLRPLQQEIVGDTARPLLVLLAAVALVLLIACANVANLLLARAASRRKEIAVRAALGASRGRIVRQLLTESVLIAVLGGALGLIVASWGVDLLVASAPDAIPRLREVGVDYRVVLFTAIVSVTTGLLFGMAPALRASRAVLNDTLKAGGRASHPMHGRAGRLLVIAEVGLSLVLLVGAGLLVRSLARVNDVAPGFDAAGVLSLRVAPMELRYTTFQKGDAFFDELFSRLRAAPAVRDVAAANALPFSGAGGSRTFNIQGRPLARLEDQPEEQLRIVTDRYFETMRIPIKSGREFTARDTLAAPRVAIVNEALARKHWPGESPIGKRVTFSNDQPVWYEIVGVAGNVKHRTLDAADRPELYVPYRQPIFASWTVRPMYVVIRTAGEPLELTATVRRELAQIDRDQPISDVRTLDARIGRSLSSRRFNTLLLVAFATLALALAGIGIYGVLGYTISERTHEIGLRLALGAQRADVRRMVVREGMSVAVVGMAAGIVAALALTRLMSSLLFGISAADPWTFAAIPVLLAAVAFLACDVPARRATRVDPMIALRSE